MNQAIWKLAYRHVHHYQKNYLFISIVVLFMSMSFITTIICYKNYYEVKKLKDINDYGTWYVETLIEEKDKDQWIEDLKDYDSLSYGWMIQEDVDDLGHVIGYVSKEIYELKNLKLIAGNYPQNDHEIMISTRIQEKMNYTLNQQITYFVDNIESQLYTIVGIVDDPNAGHATSLDIYIFSIRT